LERIELKIPLDGIALESAGVGNIGRPYEFIGDRLGISEERAHLFAPFIEPTFAWIRLRHGIDLRRVRPGVESIRAGATPLLILQGAEDEVTPLRGVRRLADAVPHRVELIVVPRMGHDWFFRAQPEVMEKVTSWFEKRATAPGRPVLVEGKDE
jgi:pimeloyl-ACP methyl ester carboxylesterase